MRKITLAAFALVAFVGVALSQGGGFWPNWPIIGGASYCSATNNAACTNTVPAGPAVSGSETVPANTNASGGTTPQNAMLSMADLNALPVSFVVVTTPPTDITATNVSGGVVYTSTTTITQANIFLPVTPINGQRYVISSNRTITTLSVNAGSSATGIGTNTNPTVLTASTTVPQGYMFIYNSTDTKWYRVQ